MKYSIIAAPLIEGCVHWILTPPLKESTLVTGISTADGTAAALI